MIPFFVADRPISLDILKLFFARNKKEFGILTHAFTTKNFQEKFKHFPYKSKLLYTNIKDTPNLNLEIENRIIKFVDSGIFIKKEIDYKELFNKYEYLNAHYGAIIDYLNDLEKTLFSAKNAKKYYAHNFNLVAVAQGKNINEYIKCYKELKDLGYKHIAIGGLLKRSGKFVKLNSTEFLQELIIAIKEEFNPSWIFTFGIYNPKRKDLLKELKIWGADYKGWLFEYEENYSFVVKEIPEIKGVLEIYLKNKTKENRKKVDEILKNYNTSLQKFRIERVIKNLEKKVVL